MYKYNVKKYNPDYRIQQGEYSLIQLQKKSDCRSPSDCPIPLHSLPGASAPGCVDFRLTAWKIIANTVLTGLLLALIRHFLV